MDDASYAYFCAFILVASGISLVVLSEGPEFHHGLMIGIGAMYPIVALWRSRALRRDDEE